MSKYADIAASLIAMSGQDEVIVIHRSFVEFTGSLEAGAMLGQLLYWTPRAKIPGGWVAKTDEDFHKELMLSKYGVRQARAALEGMGILKTKLKKFNGSPTVHYLLDLDALSAKWTSWIQQMDFSIPQNPNCENEESLTETTTEITTETTTNIYSPPKVKKSPPKEKPKAQPPAIDPAYGAAYSAYEDHFGMLTGNNREAFYELWQEFPIPEAHAKACKLMQEYVAEKRERFYSIPLYEKILRAYVAKEYERIEVDDHASSTDDSIPPESRGPRRTGPDRDRSTEPHVYAVASE